MTGKDPLLELIGEIHGLLDLAEFRSGLLAALRRAVPCDWISLNDLGPDPETVEVLVDPPFPDHAHRLYARHAYENPLVEHYQRTGDGRPFRFSDVTAAEQLRSTALYREFYGPIGLEYQIAFTLPNPPDRLLAIALSRRHHDFSDGERDLLDRARPFLIQGYQNAVEHARVRSAADLRGPPPGLDLRALRERGLTGRETEVLGWVVLGRSNAEVATLLGLSDRTVQKHLERCYRKLGVSSRSEAVAVARSRG